MDAHPAIVFMPEAAPPAEGEPHMAVQRQQSDPGAFARAMQARTARSGMRAAAHEDGHHDHDGPGSGPHGHDAIDDHEARIAALEGHHAGDGSHGDGS
jgi:hypothetical protein